MFNSFLPASSPGPRCVESLVFVRVLKGLRRRASVRTELEDDDRCAAAGLDGFSRSKGKTIAMHRKLQIRNCKDGL